MFPVAMAVAWLMAYIYAAAAIMIIVAAVMLAAQARRKKQVRLEEAKQNYYQQLQRGRTESLAFTSSQRSAKSARVNAVKYTQASEQLTDEATAREKFSRRGNTYRDLRARHLMFGNKFSARNFNVIADRELPEPLLSRQNFGNAPEAFVTLNFDVQNFNINYVEV